MDKKTVFAKTEIGESESLGNSDALFGDAKRVLHLVDDESTVAEITKRAPPSLRDSMQKVLQELVDGGYIKDVKAPLAEKSKSNLQFAKPAFKLSKPVVPTLTAVVPSVAVAASNTPLKQEAKASSTQQSSTPTGKNDLDFSFITAAASQRPSQTEAVNHKLETKITPESAIKIQPTTNAIHEADAKAAKLKAYEDAKIKAQIEVAARARIEAEARAKQNTDAVRIRAEQEAHKARAEAETAKARIEAEVRARLEAEARVKQEAEARIKREAEAIRIKAEKEAEKLRLELEAAKAKAEMELRIRLEAEARAKVELEARLKREAEAERMKLEDRKSVV